MNLGEMEQELNGIVRDSELAKGFTKMINDVILELATEFKLPALKTLTPLTLTVTTSDWLYDAPSAYLKGLRRCYQGAWEPTTIVRDMDALDALDVDHDETATRVTHVAAMDSGEERKIGIYPKANDTLYLWGYNKPALLVKPEDVCKCIPAAFHSRVILAKCVIKNFRIFLDGIEDGPMKSILYWESVYRQGLYGAPNGDIGMINFMVLSDRGRPRRSGGADPLP